MARKYRVQAWPGWTVPTNLYGVVALPSGNRKSAVFEEALAPVVERERELARLGAPAAAERASAKRQLELRLSMAERQAARGEGEERTVAQAEARRLAREVAVFEVPPTPKLFASDVTPEKIGQLLAEQGGRLLLASPEGDTFANVLGRYAGDGAPNLEAVLKGHAGDHLRVERLGRPPDDIERPALSLACCPQPAVIQGLGESKYARARGFLARFLFSVPRSLVGRRQTRRPGVPEEIASAYSRHMGTLWQLTGDSTDAGDPVPRVLPLSDEAAAHLERFERELEPRLGEDGDLAWLTDWGCKLGGHALRLAGVIHLANTVGDGLEPGVISEGEMLGALCLADEYLLPHARAAFGLMDVVPEYELAKRMLTWIKSDACRNPVTMVTEMPEITARPISGISVTIVTGFRVSRRDIYRGLRRQFGEMEAMDRPLQILLQHGYLREVPQEKAGRGRPPSPLYEVNPHWLPGIAEEEVKHAG